MNDEQNYTTGLAHLMLCGTSGWAMKNISFDVHPFAFGAFTFLLGHGLLGILRFTHPEASNNYIRKIYDKTYYIAKICPLPILNTQLYINYSQKDEISYLHAASLLPAFSSCITSDYCQKLSDVILLGNMGSLAYIGIINENYWAVGLTTLCVMNHFILDLIADHFSVPKVDLYITGLSFFSIFAVNCLL